jgi:hypothetical protein
LRGPGPHHCARALPAAASSPSAAVLLVALCGGARQGLALGAIGRALVAIGLPLVAIGQMMALASGYAWQPAHWLLLRGRRLHTDTQTCMLLHMAVAPWSVHADKLTVVS